MSFQKVIFSGFICLSFAPLSIAQTITENPRARAKEPPAQTRVLEINAVQGLYLESTEGSLSMPEFKTPTRDPLTGRVYERVIYGPVNRTWNPVATYALWRNVTVYSVQIRREGISDLPALHQSCFDGGKYPIGSWQVSRSLSVELRSSLRCGDLGLGAEISASVSEGRVFSMQRSLIVPEGIEADYVPMMRQEDWEGVTFIQTYNPSTAELGYIPADILDEAFGWYPYPFFLRNAATTFEVSRQNTKVCKKRKGQLPESGAGVPDLIFPLD